jgi:hypothetical protein
MGSDNSKANANVKTNSNTKHINNKKKLSRDNHSPISTYDEFIMTPKRREAIEYFNALKQKEEYTIDRSNLLQLMENENILNKLNRKILFRISQEYFDKNLNIGLFNSAFDSKLVNNKNNHCPFLATCEGNINNCHNNEEEFFKDIDNLFEQVKLEMLQSPPDDVKHNFNENKIYYCDCINNDNDDMINYQYTKENSSSSSSIVNNNQNCNHSKLIKIDLRKYLRSNSPFSHTIKVNSDNYKNDPRMYKTVKHINSNTLNNNNNNN